MSRRIHEFIDEQIERWRLEQLDPQGSAARRKTPPAVIAIAHQLGSNGDQIADQVAGVLGLPVYDRQVLHFLAEKADVRVETVELLDERARGRLEQYVSAQFQEKSSHYDEYVRHLTKAVVALWEHGPCVLVGHACVHIVPRDHCVAVHLVAAKEHRAQNVAERTQVPLEEARRIIDQTDADRESFHHEHFGADANDPLEYDLTIDTSGFSVEACAAIVITAMRSKFPKTESGQGSTTPQSEESGPDVD